MRLNKILLKRAVAAFAAACTLGTCCIASSIAWAVDSGTTTEPSTANIDTTKANSTSITIHKYEAPELKNVAHDGRELDSKVLVDTVGSSSVAKKQVKGVEFTIWRLKTYQTGPAATGGNTKTDEVIDLSKADGWSKINKVQYLKLPKEATPAAKPASGKSTEPTYTVDQLMNGDTTAQPSLTKQFNKYTGDATKDTTKGYCTVANTQTKDGAKCVTGDDGSVKLDQLPMGLYYIEETDISKAQINTAAAGETAVWKKVSITKAVAPFLITTPLPNSDTATQKTKPWLYDVHVYPKNDTNPELPTKTGSVNRNDLVGDTEVAKKSDSSQKKTVEGTHITWTIAIPLTAPGKDKKYTKIGFVDKLIDKLTLLKDAQQKPMVKAKIAIYKEETDKAGVKKWVPNTVESGGKQVPEEVPLDSTNDYELTNPTTDNGNTLTFKLKDNVENHGLKLAKEKYEAASKSENPKKLAKLVVEIVTKVDDTSLNEIANVANTFVDDNKTGDGDGNNPCVPGDTRDECKDKDIPNEIMHYGTLTVSKFFKAGEGQTDNGKKKNMPLNGAKFDLYEVTQKTTAGSDGSTTVGENDITKATKFDGSVTTDAQKNTSTITTKPESGTGVSYNVKKITHKEPADDSTSPATDEATTLETKKKTINKKDVDGTDSVKLLVYKAPKDNPKSVATKKLYCLVETEAPAGYKLDSAPHCVWLQEDLTHVTSPTDNATAVAERVAANLVEVENVKATELDKILGSLPMTGARGLVILTLCGIVGIAGTFFYIVLKRRKEQEQE
ncbi:SpaH/EbpB family LPXTG-anchored major pilin [Gardnerella sp. KA00747]|uniref:SpaH/EbpB family LPXTG-anchored major pilin n=1 Tax=Gardnerella sp. KA00747 TaxID=2749078 RepID=UPI003BAD1582